MSIFFFQPPQHARGIYAPELARELSLLGIPAEFDIAGNSFIGAAFSRLLPTKVLSRLLPLSTHPFFGRRALSKIRRGDTAWVYTNGQFADHKHQCPFEQALKSAGARYVFHLPDAWPLYPKWRPHVDSRVRLADFVAAVTPGLTELLRSEYPGVPCATCEEAVATENFEPDFSTENDTPVILWSGPPAKIGEVEQLAPVLESIFQKCPFILRLVTGSLRPKLSTRFPIEWKPFFGLSPKQKFRGCDIAFATYRDNPYNRCKGNYKVKTYLAAGCAVVTDPVGYNRDMVQPGVNGLFASSPDEWEAALLRLLRNPAECLAMRKAARETAVRRFSYEAIAKQYAATLRNLGWI